MASPSLTIDISVPERDALLKHVPLPTSIVARLRFALHTTKGLELTLSSDDAIDFGEAMEEHLPRIKKRNEARLVEAVFDRFVNMIHDKYIEMGGPEEELKFPPDMPEAMREAVQQVFDSGDYDTPEELMAALQEAVVRADDSHHEQLFGHTTGEVIRLIGDDWTETGGAIWMDEALSVEQLAGSTYFMDAIRFLKLAESTGGFKLTAKKSLNRESVRLLLDSGCFPYIDMEKLLSFSKILNEMDVRPLHMVHLLLLETRLVRHHKGKMVVTNSGRQMLEPDRAGSLQCVMFRTLFKEFDLGYLDMLPDYRGVQATMAFILYAIWQMAQEPVGVEDVISKAYMPAVAAELSEGGNPRHARFAFYTRVLHPLEAFGLVEIIRSGKKGDSEKPLEQVRVTPLFNAMLHFNVKNE